jgi:hypothetical protein
MTLFASSRLGRGAAGAQGISEMGIKAAFRPEWHEARRLSRSSIQGKAERRLRAKGGGRPVAWRTIAQAKPNWSPVLLPGVDSRDACPVQSVGKPVRLAGATA